MAFPYFKLYLGRSFAGCRYDARSALRLILPFGVIEQFRRRCNRTGRAGDADAATSANDWTITRIFRAKLAAMRWRPIGGPARSNTREVCGGERYIAGIKNRPNRRGYLSARCLQDFMPPGSSNERAVTAQDRSNETGARAILMLKF